MSSSSAVERDLAHVWTLMNPLLQPFISRRQLLDALHFSGRNPSQKNMRVCLEPLSFPKPVFVLACICVSLWIHTGFLCESEQRESIHLCWFYSDSSLNRGGLFRRTLGMFLHSLTDIFIIPYFDCTLQ